MLLVKVNIVYQYRKSHLLKIKNFDVVFTLFLGIKGDDKSFNFLVNCGHPVNGKKTIFGIAPIHNAIQCVNTTKND